MTTPATCPECGVPITTWMTPIPVHAAGCPIGSAEDATRARDVEQTRDITNHRQPYSRPIRAHEARLQRALGRDPGPLVHVYGHIWELDKINPEERATAPSQWLRTIPEMHTYPPAVQARFTGEKP